MIRDTGDLGPNAQRLYDRVRDLNVDGVCLDVGVRAGVSSRILLDASSIACRRVIGFDVNVCPPELESEPRYKFIRSDSVTALRKLSDVVAMAFIDTIHAAHQAAAEALEIWPLLSVGGFLAFHDTNWGPVKKDYVCNRHWPTVDVGIGWLFDGRSYAYVEHFPESWGCTFVWKTSSGAPTPVGITESEIYLGRNILLGAISGVEKLALQPNQLR